MCRRKEMPLFCLGFGIGALHVSPPHGFESLEVERF